MARSNFGTPCTFVVVFWDFYIIFSAYLIQRIELNCNYLFFIKSLQIICYKKNLVKNNNYNNYVVNTNLIL